MERFAASMNLSERRRGRGAIIVILQSGEPVRNGQGIQRQRSAASKKAALEIEPSNPRAHISIWRQTGQARLTSTHV